MKFRFTSKIHCIVPHCSGDLVTRSDVTYSASSLVTLENKRLSGIPLENHFIEFL